MNDAQRLSRWARRLAGGLLALLLAACGGTDGDAPEQVPPEPNAVTITAYSGVPAVTSYGILVKGTAGIFRNGTRDSRGLYNVKLDQLAGPYAIGLQGNDDNTGAEVFLVSLTTGPGRVNVTPLTTLVAAQLTGRPPTIFFSGLSGTGDTALAVVTEARLAEAQTQVRRLLRERYGYTVPEAVGDFLSGSFVPQAGDPMFDAIVALNEHFAANGTDVFTVAAELAAEAALCRAERLTVTAAGGSSDFCPASKHTGPDGTDATITRYRFTTRAGAELTVAARGSDVLSASLVQGDSGPSFLCSGAGCAGLTLGTPAGDQSRPVVFAAVRLTGASGSVVLDGRLQANRPGPFFPPLTCDNRYYVAYDMTRVDAACAAMDSTIGAGFGDTSWGGRERRAYLFQSDGSVEPLAPTLEIVADPDGLVSVLVQARDPDTGAVTALWKCRGEDCNGVTLGPVRDDADSFAPYVLRNRLITLDDTVLPALNPDGTPSGAGAVTVRAVLDSFEIIFPPEQQPAILACDATQRLVVTQTGLSAALEECLPATIPDDYVRENYLRSSLDLDGNTDYEIGSALTVYGGLTVSAGVRIETEGGVVARVVYSTIYGDSYRCTGAGCAGVTISAPDGAGARRITFAGVQLEEVETAGLPGERSVTLNGAFTAPAPVP